jgi:hypothetical protein
VALEQDWKEKAAPGQVTETNRCDRTDTLDFPFGEVIPYQVDIIDFYVLEENAGHKLCVPLHSWVIWEIPVK